ncbi:MAG: hypothetical protein NVSMB18_23530 [Acetobacteraceae bacterium]
MAPLSTPGSTQPRMTIWVDVADILHYFTFNPRPSGIQRLALEIMRALVAEHGTQQVRFVRRGEGEALLQEVAWPEVVAIIEAPPAPEREVRRVKAKERSRVKRAIGRLPPELRDPLFRAGVLQSQVGRTVVELAGTMRPPQPRQIRKIQPGAATGDGFGAAVREGDVFLALGAPWTLAGFAGLLDQLKRRHGMRVALLVHDLIPVRRPEWQDPAARTAFRSWLLGSLPLCDWVLAVSGHTAGDVAAFAGSSGIGLAAPVRAIPVGTTFPAVDANGVAGLPRAGGYVLFVSTLEARKNHALAVHVWRKLMDEVRAGQRAAGSVPELVFAGRVGSMVSDLLQQLDNMAYLGGRIRIVRDPTDAELRRLYEGCLFTIFPSLFEGWGLPVSESLALGKPCLASSTTAVPEAGGALCRYFDPENIGSAHRAVAALLDDRAGVAAWQAEVRREFRPTAWAAAAAAIVEQVGLERLGQ